MLKIEKLKVINTLTDEEMREVGIASMHLTKDNAVADTTGIIADGTFKLFKAGAGVNAALGLSAVLVASKTVGNATTNYTLEAVPGDVEVELRHDLAREFVFPKGASFVTTDIIVADDDLSEPAAVTVKSADGTAVTLSNENVTDRLILALSAPATEATTVKVTIKNVKIATGVAEDPNMHHSFKLCPVGDVHIDACCRFLDGKDVKPNETSFTIRAENPFTKVITLG